MKREPTSRVPIGYFLAFIGFAIYLIVLFLSGPVAMLSYSGMVAIVLLTLISSILIPKGNGIGFFGFAVFALVSCLAAQSLGMLAFSIFYTILLGIAGFLRY